MALFMFSEWWKFTTKTKPLVTSSIFIFLISKILDKVYDDFKD